MRGARIRDFAWACGKSHIAGRKRTSLQDTDIPAFSSSPTAPHIAAFYLAIARSAVCFPPVPARSFAKLRSDKKQTKHPAADSAQVRCSRYAESLVTARPSRAATSSEAGRRSCGGRARCLQIGRRKSTSRGVSAGRGSVGVVDSGREIGHGNIDANDPKPTSVNHLHHRVLSLRP